VSHPQQLGFIRAVSEHLSPDYAGWRVLEIGSYDVNGSIRPFFPRSEYVGVDLTPGPGVDVVCEGDKLAHPDETYDLTLSCECFEHNPQWRDTFMNMLRMTRPGGIVAVTCATTGRLEHGTARTSPAMSPGTLSANWNYYRNLTAQDFRSRIPIEQCFDAHFFLTNRYSNDLYFVGLKKGLKKGECPLFRFDARALREQCSEELEAQQREINARSTFPRPLGLLIGAPLRIAQRLPDRYFQEFALPYSRILRKIFMRGSAPTGGAASGGPRVQGPGGSSGEG
jgi:SAM-dependent methyltransferase